MLYVSKLVFWGQVPPFEAFDLSNYTTWYFQELSWCIQKINAYTLNNEQCLSSYKFVSKLFVFYKLNKRSAKHHYLSIAREIKLGGCKDALCQMQVGKLLFTCNYATVFKLTTFFLFNIYDVVINKPQQLKGAMSWTVLFGTQRLRQWPCMPMRNRFQYSSVSYRMCTIL